MTATFFGCYGVFAIVLTYLCVLQNNDLHVGRTKGKHINKRHTFADNITTENTGSKQ